MPLRNSKQAPCGRKAWQVGPATVNLSHPVVVFTRMPGPRQPIPQTPMQPRGAGTERTGSGMALRAQSRVVLCHGCMMAMGLRACTDRGSTMVGREAPMRQHIPSPEPAQHRIRWPPLLMRVSAGRFTTCSRPQEGRPLFSHPLAHGPTTLCPDTIMGAVSSTQPSLGRYGIMGPSRFLKALVWSRLLLRQCVQPTPTHQ